MSRRGSTRRAGRKKRAAKKIDEISDRLRQRRGVIPAQGA
jgi:hypothetical protein